LWRIPRFIDEVETVRSTLELGVVTLLGQSWGGMLALAYTLDHPANVNALILSNTHELRSLAR
jgi:proline iminopeptidase